MNLKQLRNMRRREGGQAIAELAVCLIGLLICLLAYFLISAVTQENVENVIESRVIADRSVRKGGTGGDGSAENIAEWNYGNRDIPFTKDDTVKTGASTDGPVFTTELQAENIDLTTLRGTDYMPSCYNHAYGLSMSKIFLNAADLVEGTATESDPLGKRSLTSLKDAFKSMFGVRSFFLSDNTCMPAKPIVPLPENATGQ